MTLSGTEISCSREEGTSRGSPTAPAAFLGGCLCSFPESSPGESTAWTWCVLSSSHNSISTQVLECLKCCTHAVWAVLFWLQEWGQTLKLWIGQTSLSNWIPRSAVIMPCAVVPRLSCSTCFVQREPVWRTRDCQGPSLLKLGPGIHPSQWETYLRWESEEDVNFCGWIMKFALPLPVALVQTKIWVLLRLN